jgi:hypothetical protein
VIGRPSWAEPQTNVKPEAALEAAFFMTERKPKKPKRAKPPAAEANGAAANTSTALVVTKATRKPPVRFSEEIAEVILAGLRDGKSLRSICVGDDMPDESAVRMWAEVSPFAERYEHARKIGYLRMADEMIEIADTEPDAAKARNRIDVRKFMLAKMMPKVFGDRIELDHKGGIIQLMVDAEDLKA